MAVVQGERRGSVGNRLELRRPQSHDFETGSMSQEFQIIHHTIDEASFRTFDARQRNQLVGCMHAHNELSVLNRILMFSLNDTGEGELHDSAKSVQTWCLLQLLAAKLFETWDMLNERFMAATPEDPALCQLDDDHKASLTWLKKYFGTGNRLNETSLRTIRDKATFHYDKLNPDQAAHNMADGESAVYLAQHPANSLYYVGSALVFRTVFAMIADKAHGGIVTGSHEERTKRGADIAFEDANSANDHMHMVLYGLIKFLMEEVFASPLETLAQVRINVVDAPTPENVRLPAFLDIGIL
jgi:hypothetical protein